MSFGGGGGDEEGPQQRPWSRKDSTNVRDSTWKQGGRREGGGITNWKPAVRTLNTFLQGLQGHGTGQRGGKWMVVVGVAMKNKQHVLNLKDKVTDMKNGWTIPGVSRPKMKQSL